MAMVCVLAVLLIVLMITEEMFTSIIVMITSFLIVANEAVTLMEITMDNDGF